MEPFELAIYCNPKSVLPRNNVRGPRNGLKTINDTKDQKSTSRRQKGDGSWNLMPTQMNQR